MKSIAITICLICSVCMAKAQQAQKDTLVYSNPMATQHDLDGWVMEGNGKLEFKNGWMQMYSPNQEGHHVLWCPKDFPSNFIAEWEVQNLHPKMGLCIVFFCATGVDGSNIFSPDLPKRNGKFTQYTKGLIRNYHISYYANPKYQRGRETANLRENPGFHLRQKGEKGIPLNSTAVHQVQLIKQFGSIQLFIDGRKVIDWEDHTDGYLGEGKIGFRQMKWTRFAYRNFKVWSVLPE